MFQIWDGMQMIRYDYYEMQRFKGTEPRCFDKFKSLNWISCTLLILILGIIIVSREMSSIGTMISQSVEMNYQPSFQYEILDSLVPLRATQFYVADELLSKLKNDNINDDPALNAVLSEKPLDLTDKYDTYTDAHKVWLEKLLCAGTKVSY
jgi:hypothetical protein